MTIFILTNYLANMTTKDHLFAQNWVVQFQEDYYDRTERERPLFYNFFLNRQGYILQDIIMNCLSWPSCGMREEIWRRRFSNAIQNHKQNALFR